MGSSQPCWFCSLEVWWLGLQLAVGLTASLCPGKKCRAIIKSKSCEGWKRPVRSPGPTPIHPTMPTHHVPMCHIGTALEHLERQGLHSPTGSDTVLQGSGPGGESCPTWSSPNCPRDDLCRAALRSGGGRLTQSRAYYVL